MQKFFSGLKKGVTGALLGMSLYAQAQQANLKFTVLVNGESLELNKSYFLPATNDSIRFETVKFYVSDIRFYQNETEVSRLEKQHLLIDLENPAGGLFPFQCNKPYNRIRFKLGIDSTTSVSGAMGGDLDPALNMYWAWQSGYINVKLEGQANRCKARNQYFQYHLGGYAAPFNCLQEVSLPVKPGEQVRVALSLNKFFGGIDVGSRSEVMSPGTPAVELSKQMAGSFEIQK